ncbi:diguanylate cyclase (plasmid) [Deinococcus aquaticus]|uniref:Diguanylate cyclase n=1 Tax=Deinococcus aquaticus TaxID=328692 RepID=A0ABY7V7R6_9DEIO|nr:diguanylate cyclase [Deinococcus aquaticus]WDA60323.1 diguanylate cyclase [Deinococcus aquaticus]
MRPLPTMPLQVFLATLLAGLFLTFGYTETALNNRASALHLQQSTGQSLQRLAFEMNDKLDRGMFERARDIQIISELQVFQDGQGVRDQQRRLLERLKSTFSSYAWIGLTDARGTVLASTGGLLEGQSAAQRPWFQGALRGPYTGDVHEAKLLAPLLPRQGNEPLRFVDVSAPIRDPSGRVTGTLGAHLSWTWAQEVRASLLQPAADRDHLDILILDRSGLVLLGPPGLQGKALALGTLERFPGSGYAVERWPDGRTYLTGVSRSAGYRSYPGLAWRVVVRQDTQVAFAGINRFRRTSVLVNLGLSVLFAGIGFAVAHFIARPLARLRRAAQAIGAGELNASIPHTRAYLEINALASALQQLVTRLRDNERQLERRIQARTEDLHRRTREAEALAALSVLATRTGPLPDLLRELVPVLADTCQLDWLAVTSSDPARPPETLFLHGTSPELHTGPLHHHTDGPPAQPLLISAYPADPRAHPALIRWGTQAAAVLPLPAAGAAQTLCAARRGAPHWTDGERRIFEAAARSVHISQERRAALQDLEFAALHDRLTGLGNRHAFDRTLDQTVTDAQRSGTTFGVLIIDLDGLKAVNDHSGHERGDRLLQAFATSLQAAFPAQDRLFRLGGDEYAVILAPHVATTAHAALERVGHAVQLTRAATDPGMNASGGAAFYPADAADGASLTRLADERMYTRKHQRRAHRSPVPDH